MDGLRCLGRTPGYVRYSGYDTAEEEARYLPMLGPVWKYGDPVPPVARADQFRTKPLRSKRLRPRVPNFDRRFTNENL
jgi:hypothetical protein